MSRTTRVMHCTPDDVFDVFRDGWSYATWVVGAARIRRVEEGWPEVGTHIHHSVGMWPLLISDNTEVEHYDPPRELRLKVRVWPGGEGTVTMRCTPRGPEQTEVEMEERLQSGPMSWLPNPVEDAFLHGRNVEALKRLAYLAERKARKD